MTPASAVKFDYTPREQFIAFHNRTQRWAGLVVHRRGGKTFACVNDIIIKALRSNKKNPRYAYIAPFRTQAKEIAWTYLKDQTEGLRDGPPREAELRVRLKNGAWITLYGADNPDALRGLYFDGVVLDEYGDMKPSLMGEVILPTLVDRRGWLVVIGTPKGRNQFFDLVEKAKKDVKWYFMSMKASQSGILPQEELDALAAQMPPEEYEQEMECSFDAALKGSYYTAIMNELEEKGQIVDYTLYDPEKPVNCSSDLGYADGSAWWFWQYDDPWINVIDYYTAEGEKLDHYLRMLAEREYEYAQVWLPHDARETRIIGKSAMEQMMYPGTICPEYFAADERLPVRIVPRMKVQTGINLVRLMLPFCRFDREKTFKGVDSLRAYHRRWNEVTQSYVDKPVHDWASHGADGFRMMATVAKGSRGQSGEALLRPRKQRRKMGRPATGMLQYKDGRIMTVQTLDEMAPLKQNIRIARPRRI